MTSPKTDYPNASRQYPNAKPEGPVALVGAEPAFEAQLYRLAPSRVTVLLVGGRSLLKQAVAQTLHERSPRREQPFVVFDCRGLARTDGFVFLLFGNLQFHLGLRVTPIAKGQQGLFDVPKVLRALERGASCQMDFSDHFDFFRYAAEPLDVLRARWNVPALAPDDHSAAHENSVSSRVITSRAE